MRGLAGDSARGLLHGVPAAGVDAHLVDEGVPGLLHAGEPGGLPSQAVGLPLQHASKKIKVKYYCV